MLLTALSKDLIVAPKSTFTYNSRDSSMGHLELYFIDWTGTPSASLVTILELPVVHSIPTPSPGLHGITADNIAVSFYGSTSVGFCSPGPTHYARGPPRVFEPTKSSRLFRLHIRLPYVPATQGGPPRSSSCLYIPIDVIYSAMGSCGLRVPGAVETVQWENWGSRTRWIHGHSGQLVPFYENQPLGLKCMLTQRIHDDALGTRLKLYMFDFNPMFLEDLEHSISQTNIYAAPTTTGSVKWAYQPAEASETTPTVSHIEPHKWLAESDANRAVAPYAWSLVEHEELNRIIAQGRRSTSFFWDMEHSKPITFIFKFKG
jgi:hypothetical protein